MSFTLALFPSFLVFSHVILTFDNHFLSFVTRLTFLFCLVILSSPVSTIYTPLYMLSIVLPLPIALFKVFTIEKISNFYKDKGLIKILTHKQSIPKTLNSPKPIDTELYC
jgi:hypothetical protein